MPAPHTFQSVNDLKAAIEGPEWFRTVQAMDSWLPHLIAHVQWRTAMSRRFLLHYHLDVSDEDDLLFERLLPLSEQMCDELEVFFQIVPQTKLETLALQMRFSYFIIKTRTQRTFGSLTDAHLLFYFLDPRQDRQYLDRFRHELAHWVWGRLYGEAPPLFQEGVAVYAEKCAKGEALGRRTQRIIPSAPSTVPSLSTLAHTSEFWQHEDVYEVAGSFVQFLVRHWGWERLKRLFLLSDYEDQAIHQHFQEVYEQSLEQVDGAWRAWFAANSDTIED